MQTKNRSWVFTAMLSLGIFLLCGVPALLGYFVLTIMSQLQTFKSSAYLDSLKQTTPKFVLLNQQVFDELKPPPGVQMTAEFGYYKDSAHIVGYDGYDPVISDVVYRILNPSEAVQTEVVDYYKGLLNAQGWQQDWERKGTPQEEWSYGYHRGSACVAFEFVLSEWKGNTSQYSAYKFVIWHDLWSQASVRQNRLHG